MGYDSLNFISRGKGLKTVTSYTKTGQIETLPQLIVGRYDHACGSYQTDQGDHVRFVLNINKYWIIVMQVLFVTGGRNVRGRNGNDLLASTEVMTVMTGGTWKLATSLPHARFGLRAAVVNNNIFVFGENILCFVNIKHTIVSYNVYDDDVFTGGNSKTSEQKGILQYNTTSHTWEWVGQMEKERAFHAVGVLDDVSKLCP